MPGGDSVRWVLHDLRAPLAVIRSQCDELGGGMSAAQAEELRLIRRSADRMAERIDQLLALGETTRASAPAPVDLALTAAGVADVLRPLARARGVTIALKARPASTVLGDRAVLESAVQNLLDNALRYAPRDSEIVCVVRAFAGNVRVVVEDDGPGIPLADRHRMLEPGVRGPGGQSGLGLAVVARAVERHGGEITLGDSRGGGLRVTLDLPATRVRPRAKRDSRQAGLRGSRAAEREAAPAP